MLLGKKIHRTALLFLEGIALNEPRLVQGWHGDVREEMKPKIDLSCLNLRMFLDKPYWQNEILEMAAVQADFYLPIFKPGQNLY